MQIRTLLEVVAGGLAVVGAWSYVGERTASARLEATIEAEKKTLADLQTDRDKHAAADAVRDAATQQMISQWQQTVAQLKTPQQQAAWSQQQLESALKGIQITLNPKTGEAVATIPKESLPELPAVIEKCRECDARLATAQADLASREEQMRLADLQIKALGIQRDAAVTAARGTKWQRFSNSKWVKLAIFAGGIYAGRKMK